MTLLTQVPVDHWDRFWFAKRRDAPWLVDPDVADGRVRHASADPVDWDVIAAVMAEVTRQLQRQAIQGSHGAEFVSVTPREVSKAEADILTAWVSRDEAPSFDPWSDDPINGRHRLWGVWTARPSSVLPIYSDALFYYADQAAHVDDETRAVWRESAIENLSRIPWRVRLRSRQYVRTMKEAAR